MAQSANAALTFTFLPRKEDPGFSAVSDKSVLSYYTVLENSFYAGRQFNRTIFGFKPNLKNCFSFVFRFPTQRKSSKMGR